MLIGPLIGSLPFALMFFVGGRHDSMSFEFGLVALVLGYLIGLVPALIAGAVFVAFSSLPLRAHLQQSSILTLAFGALAGLVGAGTFMALLALPTSRSFGGPSDMLLVPSALAGSVCARLSMRHSLSSRDGTMPSSQNWALAALGLVLFFGLLHVVRCQVPAG